MSYFKIPQTDNFRNQNELRQNVDTFEQSFAVLAQIANKVQQIQLGGGGQAVEAEYGLAPEDENGTTGDAFVTMVVSASSEARPFMDQYVARTG